MLTLQQDGTDILQAEADALQLGIQIFEVFQTDPPIYVWLCKLHHIHPIKELPSVLLDAGLYLISNDLFLVLHRVEVLMLDLQQCGRYGRCGLLDCNLPVFPPPRLAWVTPTRPAFHATIVQERSRGALVKLLNIVPTRSIEVRVLNPTREHTLASNVADYLLRATHAQLAPLSDFEVMNQFLTTKYCSVIYLRQNCSILKAGMQLFRG